MKTISYYFSVLSPFTYFAGDRLERIAAHHGVAIDYLPMDIMGLFGKTGGLPPKDRHISRQNYRMQEIQRIAEHSGMPVNLKPKFWPTDPKSASFTIINAPNEQGDKGQLVRNYLTACWAEDRDIANPSVVQDCLKAAGFDPEIADSDNNRAMEMFQQNTLRAEEDHVFGSPTYVIDGQVFWGQDRLDHLEWYLTK